MIISDEVKNMSIEELQKLKTRIYAQVLVEKRKSFSVDKEDLMRAENIINNLIIEKQKESN